MLFYDSAESGRYCTSFFKSNIIVLGWKGEGKYKSFIFFLLCQYILCIIVVYLVEHIFKRFCQDCIARKSRCYFLTSTFSLLIGYLYLLFSSKESKLTCGHFSFLPGVVIMTSQNSRLVKKNFAEHKKLNKKDVECSCFVSSIKACTLFIKTYPSRGASNVLSFTAKINNMLRNRSTAECVVICTNTISAEKLIKPFYKFTDLHIVLRHLAFLSSCSLLGRLARTNKSLRILPLKKYLFRMTLSYENAEWCVMFKSHIYLIPY